MDRDVVLVAALGAAVLGAGCTSSSPPSPTPSPSTPTPEPVDPDVAVLQAWFDAEELMSVRYGRFGTSFADQHLHHASEITEHLRVRGTEPVRTVQLPRPYRGTRAALLKAFAARERALAAEYQAALVNVRDPKVAVLGAELSAACRQYAAIMRLEMR